jgi:hypothetical protein
MNRNLASKFMAAVAVGLLLGLYIHFDYTHWNRLGREAFVTHQVQRFDLYMNPPRQGLHTYLGPTSLAVFVAALYEFIVLVFSAILKRLSPEIGISSRS